MARKRNVGIKLWVTDGERDSLRLAAKAEGMTVSAYLLRLHEAHTGFNHDADRLEMGVVQPDGELCKGRISDRRYKCDNPPFGLYAQCKRCYSVDKLAEKKAEKTEKSKY